MSNDTLIPDPEKDSAIAAKGRFKRLLRDTDFERLIHDTQASFSYLLLLATLTVTVALISTTAANMLPGVIPFENPRAAVIAAAGSSLMLLALAIISERVNVSSLAETIRTLASRSRRLLEILGVRRSPRQALTALLLGLAGGALALGVQKFLLLTVTFPPSTQPDARWAAIANVSPTMGGVFFASYAPFWEETFNRGLLLLVVAFVALRSSSRCTQVAVMVVALTITSAWFGYGHLNFSTANAVTAGFEGVIFGALAVQQRSIWPAVIAHAAMNFGIALSLI
jgi:membrane protease YdiL (CAAX protease family)